MNKYVKLIIPLEIQHGKNESGNTVVDTSSATDGCTRDFDQCDQMILQFTSVYQCYTATLHASLSRADCVMSRITNSKDPSSDDGEGEESVQGVLAQRLLLPASSGLSLVITGIL